MRVNIARHASRENRGLDVRPDIRLSVGKTLPGHAAQRLGGAFRVGHAKSRALVVAEIEFAEIPLQMLGADVVVSPDDAALQNRKVAFDCVGVRLAANVLADAVAYGLMFAVLGA